MRQKMHAKDDAYYRSCGYAVMSFGRYLGSRLNEIPDDYLLYLLNGKERPIGGKLLLYTSHRFGRPLKTFVVSWTDLFGKHEESILAFTRQDAKRIFRRDFSTPLSVPIKVSEVKQ